jgi:hypothetical protein
VAQTVTDAIEPLANKTDAVSEIAAQNWLVVIA